MLEFLLTRDQFEPGQLSTYRYDRDYVQKSRPRVGARSVTASAFSSPVTRRLVSMNKTALTSNWRIALKFLMPYPLLFVTLPSVCNVMLPSEVPALVMTVCREAKNNVHDGVNS